MSLQEALLFIRKDLRLSQEGFAIKTGFSGRSQVCALERGRLPLTYKTLKMLCDKLGYNIDIIITKK